MPILRALGNIISGNAKQTQHVIECGIINYLKQYLTHENKSMRKEACWILSNIAAGTILQQTSIINSEILPILCQIMKNDIPEVNIITNLNIK